MITIKQKGDFSNTRGFLQRSLELFGESELDKYGRMGVEALYEATPKDTGLTAASWKYEIKHNSKGSVIRWYNTNVQNGQNIAVILQYGHGTKSGKWVQGRDYINPAMRAAFDQIAEDAWNEVVKK